jgi:hypothetical protein
MKEELRGLIQAGRQKEVADLLPYVDDRAADKPGRWTPRDQLAHLAFYRESTASDIDRARAGSPTTFTPEDIDIKNARIYDETHRLPAATIRKSASDAWDHLAAALDACSEEDLMKPRRTEVPGYRLADESPDPELVWEAIQGTANFHLADHVGFMHREMGNDVAAEATAKWSYELANSLMNDDRSRGTAVYNLGCFYARRGRAEEALPYLKAGIELRPALREWAKQDTDLDPIRSMPEVATLLG